MRALIVTSIYGGPGRGTWLLDDLADELLSRGWQVDVVVADATHPNPRGWRRDVPHGLRVFSVGPVAVGGGRFWKARTYLRMGWRMHTSAWRELADDYDLGVYTSIASFSWRLPGRLRRKGRIRRLVLVLWDFFPVHQIEIGRLRNGRFAGVMRAIERSAAADADVIALMTEANVRFFDKYFALDRGTVILPPWSTAPAVVAAPGRWESDVLRIVWGGQMVAGRGLPDFFDALRGLERDPLYRGRVEVLIAGDGLDRAQIEAAAAGLTSVTFTGSLPREQFRALLDSAHVGLAVTVGGVSVPTFPSKIVEYSGRGLPSLVCVEAASDLSDLIVERGFGFYALAGDDAAIASAVRAAIAELDAATLAHRGEAARRFWESELSVERAADRLIAVVDTV